MLGPFFFDGNVNRQSYLNEVIPLMAVLFQNQFNKNRFQCLCWVIGSLCKTKPTFWRKCLSLHNNTKWPPRSPNLTPCDVFLWGYLKDKISKTPPESLNVLRQKIITECNLLRENRN